MWDVFQLIGVIFNIINISFPGIMSSLVAQREKHLPAMQETQVRFLGLEDPLEKEMATHPSILACKIQASLPGWRSLVGL